MSSNDEHEDAAAFLKVLGLLLLILGVGLTITGICGSVQRAHAEEDLIAVRLPHGQYVEGLHREFAVTLWSMMEQESTLDTNTYSQVEYPVGSGIWWEQLGCLQLLWDDSIKKLTDELHYTKEDLMDCGVNVRVAHLKWTRAGHCWCRWSTQPRYRTEGGDDGSGF